jgi:thiol-disulfide isomerase/thioredoxin
MPRILLPHPRLLRSALFLAAFLAALRLTAAPTAWEESALFGVKVGGAYDTTARVFQPRDYKPYLLLLSRTLPGPLLLDLSKKTASILTSADVTLGNEELTTVGIPKGKPSGTYTVQNNVTILTVAGKKIEIQIRPALVGEVSPAIILAHSPDYGLRKNAYRPDGRSIAALKKYAKDTEVVVMFASWCPTCKIVLPKVLRVLEDVGNPRFSVRYYGIAMGGEEPRAALEKYGHDYPAVIFLQNGKELGRIIGEPVLPMEKAFLANLK